MRRIPREERVTPAGSLQPLHSGELVRPVVDHDVHGSGDLLVAWPLCPSCARERATMCPFCRTAGNEFPRGDDAEREWHEESGGLPITSKPTDDDPERAPTLRVICPTCDEPFSPEFFNECAWCGHEFPDGRPTPNRLRQSLAPRTAEWTPQAVAAVWIMAGLLAVIFGYFGFIARR